MGRISSMFLVLLSFPFTVKAQVACPATTYHLASLFQAPIDGSTIAAQFNSNCGLFTCGYQVDFNHATATCHVRPNDTPVNDCIMRFTDTYTLSGPGSSPVVLTAVARSDVPGASCLVDGGPPGSPPILVQYAGDVSVVHSGVDSVAAAYLPPVSGVELSLPVRVTPGVPFQVAVVVHAHASAGFGPPCFVYSEVTSTLRFDGLPSGYGVQSCKGFSQGPVVPTRATTWGRVKTVYR